ncbi:Tuberculostearic acid methyltransferase UfaA1 [Hypsizygus marmoreus]|uniref:Tuberculostearic acid methyltransferase UfaA1 n=1 Tax=Hypsizygus marmoreus TaxID=39966 RepID=A0A369J3Q8_HYPMA|nr:Tuberculostearic acid methyltransferase UfaA1 [Hypsizygus marmoreus]
MSKQLLDTPAKHPFSLSAAVDRTWNRISEAAFKTGWKPVARLAEAAVIALMENITNGQLRVLTYSHIYKFPVVSNQAQDVEEEKEFRAELRVVNDQFWVRLCAMSDLGFAEAYMYGDVECDDLVSLFHIFLDNRENLSNLDSKISYLFTLPQKITSYRFLNTIGNSRSNISAHYDISNEMFAGFLSEDMTYSCAIFEDLDGDLKIDLPRGEWSGGQGLRRVTPKVSLDSLDSPSFQKANGNGHSHPLILRDELHEAQIRKLSHIIRKAQIEPGHRILEIGSGWGSMAILIARTIPGTRVDTITLSVQQQSLAQDRIAMAGLEDRINVHLMDYRHMPVEWEGIFDRVISVEMIEAVGAEFLEKYWQVVDWAMKRKGGVGVVQVITIPEARFDRYLREIDFIRKWSMPFPSHIYEGTHTQIQPLIAQQWKRDLRDASSLIPCRTSGHITPVPCVNGGDVSLTGANRKLRSLRESGSITTAIVKWALRRGPSEITSSPLFAKVIRAINATSMSDLITVSFLRQIPATDRREKYGCSYN